MGPVRDWASYCQYTHCSSGKSRWSTKANALGNDVSVLLGNGDGTFQAPVTFATGGTPRLVAIADVDGNTANDLLGARETGEDGPSARVAAHDLLQLLRASRQNAA